jgi:hypothetical protein
MMRIKEPDKENRRLKKRYIKGHIRTDIVAEALAKNCKSFSLTSDGQMRVEENGLSIRLPCEAFGLSESEHRYQKTVSTENARITE